MARRRPLRQAVTGGAVRVLGERVAFDPTQLRGHAVEAARSLLGALLVRRFEGGQVVARIVETEAYRQDDPASHTYGRRTARVEPMFGPPGTAYVYRSYGIHWCCNVSVEEEGVGAAVLLRAALLLDGAPRVRDLRPTARADRDLLRGPGNLCRGLDIDAPRHDGTDLVGAGGDLHRADDGWRPDPAAVVAGPRVGVRLAADVPWRLHLAGIPEVSRYARSPRAPRVG